MFRILHPLRYRRLVQARRDQDHIFAQLRRRSFVAED